MTTAKLSSNHNRHNVTGSMVADRTSRRRWSVQIPMHDGGGFLGAGRRSNLSPTSLPPNAPLGNRRRHYVYIPRPAHGRPTLHMLPFRGSRRSVGACDTPVVGRFSRMYVYTVGGQRTYRAASGAVRRMSTSCPVSAAPARGEQSRRIALTRKIGRRVAAAAARMRDCQVSTGTVRLLSRRHAVMRPIS